VRLAVAALAAALLWAAPPQAATLQLDGNFVQGGLVQGRTDPGARLALDGRTVRVGDDGRFVFGFGRDHGPDAVLAVQRPDGTTERQALKIGARTWDIQRIDGLPPKMVTPDPQVIERIKRENAAIAEVRSHDTPRPWFETGFVWPALGPISGIFGSQRILNGEPRQPHFGIDIAAPAGSPVVASTDGQVVLAEPDLYFTGGTIILDHGFGLTAAYSHMQKLLVKVGDRVKQGQPIGLVGATGRVTAAHLDFRVNWFDQRLDPQLLLPPMPAKE